MATRKVRTGASYRFDPVLLDRTNPPFDVAPGDVVTVIALPGCPRPNVMGMCHVARDGRFAGMVCTNSLTPIRKGATS